MIVGQPLAPGEKGAALCPLATLLPTEAPSLGPGSPGLWVRCDQGGLQGVGLQLTLLSLVWATHLSHQLTAQTHTSQWGPAPDLQP